MKCEVCRKGRPKIWGKGYCSQKCVEVEAQRTIVWPVPAKELIKRFESHETKEEEAG